MLASNQLSKQEKRDGRLKSKKAK